MKELSLHILDIIQNSISAKASLITIFIEEDDVKDRLSIEITDNGVGMDEEMLEKVADPFVTTRKSRRVGLGISLFKAAAESCEGSFTIQSIKGKGTTVIALFQKSHIDRVPLGNMAETIAACIHGNEEIEYFYKHVYNGNTFIFDTKEIKQILGEVPITSVDVISWIKEHIQEGLNELYIKS
ncbi:Histidine kinase-, DNA gyrase B-, and HSP90-like ATPase [Geosporobacter subterraneus DSM 17957]|uniref:histidine kinase n=1 Tax=Geosporobacter subterraneus DSM 17957 TaxID=1121919 RepID=A0A1M6HIJ8_9FIRM|nr:ATP-binding protein [Geosporobacter subterraneus]SHJ22025.1 Histidine kinase-, DNA gyrase B-, and HSP90-like ATPase [Geosporobacter subterraneus DSM 17957]